MLTLLQSSNRVPQLDHCWSKLIVPESCQGIALTNMAGSLDILTGATAWSMVPTKRHDIRANMLPNHARPNTYYILTAYTARNLTS